MVPYLPRPDPLIILHESWFFLACAGLLGSVAGATLGGAHQRGRTYVAGICGPALTATLVLSGVMIRDGNLTIGARAGDTLLAIAVWLFWMFLGSLALLPLALPCALVAEDFNDPSRDRPGRKARWIAFATLPWLALGALFLLPH